MEDTLPGRVRFGAFELDLKSGELLGGGRKVVLQDQPFKVLRILVDYGGEVVSREVIQKKLWPNDTVVEFDHSINAVINKLRRVLRDSAEEPKYIETLARRGYRLIAPVERLDSSAGDVMPSTKDSDSEDGGQQPGGEDGRLERLKLEPAGWAGKTISHYRVLNIIDGGGMGVVYRAQDLKLPRGVAIKFLPEEFGNDPRALERFEREARAASVLEHPNICSIYEFGEHEGQPFIVMQLLQGQTLRQRLAAAHDPGAVAGHEKTLAVHEMLDIAIQVASGLEAAHEKGVIHRDIKPANIFIADKGVVKILDFGLAKLLLPSEPEVQLSDQDTESDRAMMRGKVRDAIHLTRPGVAPGTAAYMSPEQVRGEKLDPRTDLFSFGVVLYEMATGQRAFAGETEAVLHAAIVKQIPVPVRELNSTVPLELEPIIAKALEKDREQRYQSAAQMRADLETVKRGRESTPFPTPASAKPRGWKSWLLPAVVLLVLSGAIVSVDWYRHRRLQLTDKDSIVLADFTNSTSDPVFNDALNTALRVELEQTPFLNLLAPDKVRGTLKLLNHPENDRLTPELARKVCVRSNSKALVTGSIADVGNRYRIELKALDCQTGNPLATTQRETANREEVVKTLGAAGAELRSKLGEPKATLQEFNRPLDEATSASLEALQAFAAGEEQKRQGSAVAALPYFKRAVELDPNYAQAYASLGHAYRNVAEIKPYIQALGKAYELRQRASRRQRFYIDGIYFWLVTGNLEKALQVFTEWTKTYPKDPLAHVSLSAVAMQVGQYEKAAAEANESIRLLPTAPAYTDESMSYLKLDRLDDAKPVIEEAQTLNLVSNFLPLARYKLAFLKDDRAALEEQVKSTVGPSLGGLLCIHSYTQAYYGRLGEARNFLQQLLDLARRDNSPDTAAECLTGNALQEAEIGDIARARQYAADAMALSAGQNALIRSAMALARAGDVAQAEKLAEQANQQYPLDTMVQNYSLPTIQAAIELQRNNPGKAIEILKIALPYEMGFGSLDYFYPAFVRGDAYLKAGQGQQAAAEFQKLLDNPGIAENFVIGALAHLQLGRAQAMMGDTAGARKSYKDFFTLWKDADRDVPILQRATAEYAKL